MAEDRGRCNQGIDQEGTQMKKFRNTGIEGGYGSLDSQNYLLRLRRRIQQLGKKTGESSSHLHAQRKFEPPSKQLPHLGLNTKHTATLLQYDKEKGYHGGRSTTYTLVKKGFLKQIKPPSRVTSWDIFGAVFEITEEGRAYVELLKSPVVPHQKKGVKS